ncbi:MAG TPA: 7-carboxy-7-deazaguanine synthase QueE [Candidatus Hydrogenedentes bacterium]|nr:7-carboxy-7-deazaguanine synthase QueE [Candidatus Hydrogenedentota bacterium]HOS02895.1 7-carboxy-7-deazaguanine synthase QueE [Candidatus Hydrogenedentota bacterium]
MNVTVAELFYSIQGESSWAGLPCLFVRLAGCDLHCIWCDTPHARENGMEMSLEEVVAWCTGHECRLVEITGGEPLLQEGCPPLAQLLIEKGFTTLCETCGALPIDRLPDTVIRIMDLKCPGSGECGRNDWANVARLTPRDEVKFVIADRADYEWSRDVVSRYDLTSLCKEVLFSPVLDAIAPRDLAAWILEDGLPVRFQLQLHKIVWHPAQRGV